MTIGDVRSEAWLMISEIEELKGRRLNLEDFDDRSEVLKRLYNRCVRYREQKIRNAVPLDVEDEQDEDAAPASTWLAAPRESDPIFALMEQEGISERRDIQKRFGYSQATAYILLGLHFAGNVTQLSEHLAITYQTFWKRLRWGMDHVKVQPSLYDRTEILDSAFVPPRRRRYIFSRRRRAEARQLSWMLHDEAHKRTTTGIVALGRYIVGRFKGTERA